MYSGYHAGTINNNNIFAYRADGKVFLCRLSFPRSWDDGLISNNLFPIIHETIGSDKISFDQGFPRNGEDIAY